MTLYTSTDLLLEQSDVHDKKMRTIQRPRSVSESWGEKERAEENCHVPHLINFIFIDRTISS